MKQNATTIFLVDRLARILLLARGPADDYPLMHSVHQVEVFCHLDA